MNNTLTAKEWLEKEGIYTSVAQGINLEIIAQRMVINSELMEKYANYKNRILEDRIKEFRNKLTEAQFNMFLKDQENKTWTIEEKSILSLLSLEYDKHFNIENKK